MGGCVCRFLCVSPCSAHVLNPGSTVLLRESSDPARSTELPPPVSIVDTSGASPTLKVRELPGHLTKMQILMQYVWGDGSEVGHI